MRPESVSPRRFVQKPPGSLLKVELPDLHWFNSTLPIIVRMSTEGSTEVPTPERNPGWDKCSKQTGVEPRHPCSGFARHLILRRGGKGPPIYDPRYDSRRQPPQAPVLVPINKQPQAPPPPQISRDFGNQLLPNPRLLAAYAQALVSQQNQLVTPPISWRKQ
ncbi:hypothetical protein N7501_010332 [Penicillium viridicatum]|nr:hypothetical protein N7501_010332 [Penicillium viridicatum]